jgi:hypothetical protein
MTIKSYIKKIRKKDKMVRLTITQAIEYLLDKVLDMLDMNVIDEKKAKEMSKDITALEGNPLELKVRLEKESRGKYTLKGSREATNISFAPNESQTTYKEAESLVGSIGTFVGKSGLKYECGVYCKKVVIKKDTKKK